MICLSTEEHARRLANIKIAEQGIRHALRRYLITDYLPGQVTYNLGEYPSVKPWEISEADEHLLEEYKTAGIQLVQIAEEWNDAQRLFGGDKFTPVNPDGLRRFMDMAHSRGLKVMLYGSTGFFEMRDPDFRPEWARKGATLIEAWYRYATCSPASPSWRAYVLPRLMGLMDELGADGIYDDLGYSRWAWDKLPSTPDEIMAFEERPDRDGALADLLSLVYAEVKRRGDVFKVHGGPLTDLRVYDYLWVGEGVENLDHLREEVKHHRPYVTPCFDLSRARVSSEDELYLHTIPYLQFPLLIGGKPVTGERVMVPGIQYQDESTDFWTRHCRAIYRHYREHPEGPYSYGGWDAVPGRPDAKERYYYWLKMYRPMVTEGTWAYLEISDSNLFVSPLPQSVVASAYANQEFWLVLANYGKETKEVITGEAFTLVNAKNETAERKNFCLPGRSLTILQKKKTG